MALMLSACSPMTKEITADMAAEQVTEDRKEIHQNGPVAEALKLEDVMSMALKHNLDAQVAAMDELINADDVSLEMLSALPSVSAKVQRVGRNNVGGSTSVSVATGQQSLQASYSTEQYRTTRALNVEWNLLDAGISIGRGLSASDRVLVAQERRRKVYHNVLQDTYTAFWRSAVAQMALPKLDDLLVKSNDSLNILDQKIEQGLVPLAEAQDDRSALLAQRQELLNLQQNLSLAELELKTLIDYPLDKPIHLDLQGRDWMSPSRLPKVNDDIDSLIDTALVSRPEIHEEILNKRIAKRDMKLSILQMFPGIDLILGFNKDRNKYLVYNSWIDGVVGLTANINNIITTPARYSRAKNNQELTERRRLALVAAVMTQVHIAKIRYDSLNDIYTDFVRSDDNAQSILKRADDFSNNGLMSDADLVTAQIEATLSSVNKAISFTEVQDAYGRLVNTLGTDLWDDQGRIVMPAYNMPIYNEPKSELQPAEQAPQDLTPETQQEAPQAIEWQEISELSAKNSKGGKS